MDKNKSFDNSDKTLISFFNKLSKNRKESDIRKISKYLSKNYTYFINLKSAKDSNPQKIEKIIKYAKLEEFPPNSLIFNYGDPGDKFYILLKGSVSLYKPEYKEVLLTPYEFYEELKHIKETEMDLLKYKRVIEKNSHLLGKNIKDISYLAKNRSYFAFNKKLFFMEHMEIIGAFKEGFAFGEMALIKKATRNATVRTNTQSLFLTIGKKDYNTAIREMHDKILSKDIDNFVKAFPIFNIFNKELLLEVLNGLSHKTIYKGDYLFKKGEESNNVYFLKSGIINLNFNFSFASLDEYLNYFNDNSGNMIMYLNNKKPNTFSELMSIIKNKTENLNEKYNVKLDDEETINNKKWEECNEKINKNNFMGLKNEEDKLNNEDKVFNINLKTIKTQEIIGLEEAIECKKRFFTAICLSEHADILAIKTHNLIKICRSLKEYYLFEFLSFLVKRKDILTFQIINKVKYLEKNIMFSLNNKYDMLKGDEIDLEKESDKDRIVSLIKFKGFKKNINELLDTNIDLKDYCQSSIACKSLNLRMINPTPKDVANKNKQNLKLLKKIDDVNPDKYHLLKLKKNIINTSSCYYFHKINKNKNLKSSVFYCSPLSSKLKSLFFTKEKTYDNYNNFSAFNNVIGNSKTKKILNYNSSPKNKSNNNKLFTKIFPKLNKTHREYFKEIANKMQSGYFSPYKESSSFNYTETAENEKKKIENYNNKNKKVISFTKLNKKKNLNIEQYRVKDIENSEDNKFKSVFSKEKTYYDKIRNEKNDFFLGERFRKKFMKEYNKINPIHYHSYIMKAKK